jgi:VanZ family protein
MHQVVVPGRNAGIFDVLVDSAGIFFATIIYLITLKPKQTFLD